MRTNLLIIVLLSFPMMIDSHPGWGIVIDKQANIYFPDIMHNDGTIWKLTPDGNLIKIIDHCHAHNVVLDDLGNLYTAHGEDLQAMLKISPEGQVDTIFQTRDIDQFFGGNCTWSSRHGIIHGLKSKQQLYTISDSGIQKPLSAFKFVWNQVIYVADDHKVYATDIGIDEGSVIEIDTNGNAQIIATHLISKLDRPRDEHNDVLLGLTKSEDGFIYVAETAGKRIIKILDNNKTENFYQSKSNWFPVAIDFHDGEAFIMEYRFSRSGMKGPRILKIKKNGSREILFEYEKYMNEIEEPSQDNKEAHFFFIAIRNLSFFLLLIAMTLVVIQFAQKRKQVI